VLQRGICPRVPRMGFWKGFGGVGWRRDMEMG